MKKTFILVAALVMAASAGCDKAGNIDVPAVSHETIYMSFTAAAPPAPCGGETKVGISGDHNKGYVTCWETGDMVDISLYSLNSDKSLSKRLGYSYSGFSGNITEGNKAVFKGELYSTKIGNDKNAEYAIAAVYPFLSKGSTEIPSSQTMNGTSFDKKAAVMISKLKSIISKNLNYQGGSKYYNEQVGAELEFFHVGTFLNVYVKELSAASVSGDEIVKTVTITAQGKAIAGTVDSFNYGKLGVDDDPAERTDLMTMKTASNTITVNVPDGTELKDLSAMAVAAPFSLEAEYLTIAIKTDRHSLQKTMKLTRDFKPGRMTAIGFKVDKSFDAKPYIEVRQTDLTLDYFGTEKTFDIDANVQWDVDQASVPEGLTVKKVGETLSVTPPESSHFGDKKYTVMLKGNDGKTTKNVEFIQPSIWDVNEACEVRSDGSLLIGKSSSVLEPQIKLKEKVTYYNIAWDITDGKGFTDKSSPMISVKTEAGDGQYLVEFRFGGGTDGNKYLVGKDVDKKANKDVSLSGSDFNNLKEIQASLSTTSNIGFNLSLNLQAHADCGEGAYQFMNNSTSISTVYWPSNPQGELTFTLKNRGGSSFVISSYELHSLTVGEEKKL